MHSLASTPASVQKKLKRNMRNVKGKIPKLHFTAQGKENSTTKGENKEHQTKFTSSFGESDATPLLLVGNWIGGRVVLRSHFRRLGLVCGAGNGRGGKLTTAAVMPKKVLIQNAFILHLNITI